MTRLLLRAALLFGVSLALVGVLGLLRPGEQPQTIATR